MTILRSVYKKERENMEMLSKDRNPKKQHSPPVDANFSLPENYELHCVVVLLLCGIMRGTSYLYIFSTNILTGDEFSWGSNIIFIL